MPAPRDTKQVADNAMTELAGARATDATTLEQAPIRRAAIEGGAAVRYRELGTGQPVVLVHGLLNNGLLWRHVAPALAREFRVIVPDWPLGSHELPLGPGADLRPPGLARVIAGFLAALDLKEVTLVGNDTGGALCQLVVTSAPERVGRLVLTPCDAYDNFLPAMFRPLQVASHVPGATWLIVNSLRPRLARRLPMAFGWLAKHGVPAELSDAFLRPALADRRVRGDLTAILRGISSRYTLDAAARLREFDRPVLIAWAPEDRFFPLDHARRLAATFPQARLETIDDAHTYVSLDQPQRTTELIAEFARAPLARAQPTTAS
jgi:pimeloyl-ACP methyl ester carboxylesterase